MFCHYPALQLGVLKRQEIPPSAFESRTEAGPEGPPQQL